MTRCVAVIAAGGGGARFGGAKQFAVVAGKPLLWHSVAAFCACDFVSEIRVVVAQDKVADAESALSDIDDARVQVIGRGGATRAESVLNGIMAPPALMTNDELRITNKWTARRYARALDDEGSSASECDGGSSAAAEQEPPKLPPAHDQFRQPQSCPAASSPPMAVVHDGARGCVRVSDIARLWAQRGDGAILAVAVADALKKAEGDFVWESVERDDYFLAQTPQVFRADALALALARHPSAADEAEAMAAEGAEVKIVAGSRDNIKVTFPEDLAVAEAILKAAAQSEAEQPQSCPAASSPPMAVGNGFDVHVLGLGLPLVLGGVRVAHTHGLRGHSDADALCHAIIDAMLGAMAMGDIGRHFPDSDAAYAGARSLELLRAVAAKVRAAGGRVMNVDATVALQAPKLAEYIGEMRANIAGALGVAAGRVSVKATSGEGLGFVGRREGAAVWAVALLQTTAADETGAAGAE